MEYLTQDIVNGNNVNSNEIEERMSISTEKQLEEQADNTINYLRFIRKIAVRVYFSQNCIASELLQELTTDNYSAFMFRKSNQIMEFGRDRNISREKVIQLAQKHNMDQILKCLVSTYLEYVVYLLKHKCHTLDTKRLQKLVKDIQIVIEVVKFTYRMKDLFKTELDKIIVTFVNDVLEVMACLDENNDIVQIVLFDILCNIICIKNVRAFTVKKITELFEKLLEYLKENRKCTDNMILNSFYSYASIVISCNSNGYKIDKLSRNSFMDIIQKLFEFMPKNIAYDIKNSSLFDD